MKDQGAGAGWLSERCSLTGHGWSQSCSITVPVDPAQLSASVKAREAGARGKRPKREPPWSWSEGPTGPPAKDFAQLSVEEQASKLLQFFQDLNKSGVVVSDEELARGAERHFELVKKHRGDGMGLDKATNLAIAEQLNTEHPHPQWLLKLAALQLMLQYEPKFEAERKQKEAERRREMERRLERATIDCWTDILRDQGVSNPRTQAKAKYAEWMGIDVPSLKQRQRRERRRRERRK